MTPLDELTARGREVARVRRAVDMAAIDWLAVHGYLCLGLRHPATRALLSRPGVVGFVKQLGAALVAWEVLTVEQLREVERVEIEEGGL